MDPNETYESFMDESNYLLGQLWGTTCRVSSQISEFVFAVVVTSLDSWGKKEEEKSIIITNEPTYSN